MAISDWLKIQHRLRAKIRRDYIKVVYSMTGGTCYGPVAMQFSAAVASHSEPSLSGQNL